MRQRSELEQELKEKRATSTIEGQIYAQDAAVEILLDIRELLLLIKIATERIERHQ